MNKVLFFARDPAGANVIAPIIKKWQRYKNWLVVIYAKDYALDRLRKEGYLVHDILEKANCITEQIIEKFITDVVPDVVITGSSLDDFTERYIWKVTCAKNIYSYAIMDQWINLGARFSPYDYHGLLKYNSHHVHTFIPRKILVMDELAKNMLINDGLPENIIAITGQPHFDTIIEKYKRAVKYQYNDSEIRILFVSEPKSIDGEYEYWGVNEKTIFQSYYHVIEKIVKNTNKKFHIIIRPHPRESKNNWNAIIETYKNKQIKLSINDFDDSFTLIKNVAVVCGIASMLLIEAIFCNVPTISCLIGLQQESPFVFDKIGIYRSCRNEDELYKQLWAFIIQGSKMHISVELTKNATQKTIDYIQEDFSYGSSSN